MKILVRLPNWLGDMVMSIAFLHALYDQFPGCTVSVIAKRGIDDLLDYFPVNGERFIFSKAEYPGIRGAWRFGRMLRRTETFDVFFTLPDSFSSALIGLASGAKQRVGYKNEFRQFLLTHSYAKVAGMHRVEQYVELLKRFSGCNIPSSAVLLNAANRPSIDQIVINLNSEASSRRLPVTIAVELISEVQSRFNKKILLIGGKADIEHVETIRELLPDQRNIESIAGKTSLPELIDVLRSSLVLLSTDSGPAHLSNALGTPTVVLFGAGNEKNTAPFNEERRTILRLGKLACEPCTKNVCVLYGIPQCLQLLDVKQIANEVAKALELQKSS